MRFEFTTASHIIFGSGTVAEAPRLAKEWGRKALVVTGRSMRHAQALIDHLSEARIQSTIVSVAQEPTATLIQECAAQARKSGAEMVIGIGGGSVLDSAKAIAALMTNEEPLLHYLEVVGRGNPLELPPVPWMAIPTTAGTGAEATRNAVITVPESGIKASLRSPHLLAAAAVIDPDLTLSAPPSLTAASGMDALSQLIEAYTCSRGNPMVDALCEAGIPKCAHALFAAFQNGQDLAARADLCLASLWSGMALANSGLGAVHGFAAPLGAMFGAPHGAVCGALLCPVMEANLGALHDRSPQHPVIGRYADIARWLTRRLDATAEDGIKWVRHLTESMQLPRLTDHGVAAAHFPEIIVRAQNASSMKANPIVLTTSELQGILEKSL